jgi:hypothetical protein
MSLWSTDDTTVQLASQSSGSRHPGALPFQGNLDTMSVDLQEANRMDITLAITDEGHVQVTVDGACSHSFDPAPLVPDAQVRERAFAQEPAREGARLFYALFPPGSVAREALDNQKGKELAGEEPLPAWLAGEEP